MSQKKMFEVICTDCGKTAKVPFKPKKSRPAYCSTCFSKRRIKQRESVALGSNFNQKHAWAQRRDKWRGRKEEPTNVFQNT